MTRPLLFLLLAIPLTAAAAPLGPGGIGKESGEQLLARCEPALRMIESGSDAGLSVAQSIEATSCIGFVDGFIWGHAWSAWRERTDMFYCPPELFSVDTGCSCPAPRSHPRKRGPCSAFRGPSLQVDPARPPAALRGVQQRLSVQAVMRARWCLVHCSSPLFNFELGCE